MSALAKLESAIPSERLDGVVTLVVEGVPARARSHLLRLVADPDSSVRKNAARALGELAPDSAVVDALCRLCVDKEEDVRVAALFAAGSSVRAFTCVREALQSAMLDGSAWVRLTAAQAFARELIADRSVLRELAEGLRRGRNEHESELLLRLIGNLGIRTDDVLRVAVSLRDGGNLRISGIAAETEREITGDK
jgi:HEAT repeat protein